MSAHSDLWDRSFLKDSDLTVKYARGLRQLCDSEVGTRIFFSDLVLDNVETTASLLIQHHEQDRCTFSEFVVDTSVSVRVSGTGISMCGGLFSAT